jgi:ankyrin repeat protein
MKDGQGRTPLFEASNVTAAELLIENGAQIGVRSKNGETALHYAVRFRHYEIVEFLVAKGADVNAENNYVWPPLHGAITNKDNKMIELLYTLGAKEYTPR